MDRVRKAAWGSRRLAADVHRGSVGATNRRVAYLRRDGDPELPVLAAFHQTPLSSWTYRPLLEASNYAGAIYAFDTPGYGDSDPLCAATGPDRDPTDLRVYSRRLEDALCSLVPDKPLLLLGQHTGAHLALLMAVDDAVDVRGVVFQGLTLYTETERMERLRDYAPAIRPQADGGHLVAIWERIGRLYPSATVELRDRMVRDYLAADPDYGAAYRAVFAFDVEPAAAAFAGARIPSVVAIGTRDLVYERQQRVLDRFGSELIALEGRTDHAVSQDPVGFAAALDPWLARRAGGGPR